MANNGSKAVIIPPKQTAPMDKSFLETETLEDQLGIRFNAPALLVQALTHRSYANENKKNQPELENNERLEFLGDAVLEFITGDWLYTQFPDLHEGQLTRLRAALVRTERLAEFALACGIDKMMRLGHGEERNGGRGRNSTLCNTFEAIIGALYLDQGEAAVREFIIPIFEPALENTLQEVSTKDAKSRLQEWSQSQPENITPRYYTLAASGPDHAKRFLVEVRLDELPLAWGNGRSKRRAQQAAAQMALDDIEDNDPAE